MSLSAEAESAAAAAATERFQRHDSLYGDAEKVTNGKHHGSGVQYLVSHMTFFLLAHFRRHSCPPVFPLDIDDVTIYGHGLIACVRRAGQLGADADAGVPEHRRGVRRHRDVAAVRVLEHVPGRHPAPRRPPRRPLAHPLHSHPHPHAQVRLRRPPRQRQWRW